ncbi:RagB/SusD family nutrient uptake outer membrane protein [Seonamhaeicola algicola]|uniref:RagB/SusD family nutrient uptake outer membrane protein n=1 Tax=Seonamhaeicola algicola TaxID=1719036 RepID=A0A5C7AUH0_9FLAO|nr:RagB/SusD family nutrient uptake outer membrane protein [Seonamhaeicola algicola]TXE10155.1 RagB/SusD family nutrient uptake outer membrane protein [Seonamhaeicola algicola]
MKNIKLIIVCIITACVTFTSCDDVLDTTALDAFGEDLVYNDPDQVERLVYSAYNSTESWGLNKTIWWSRRYNLEAGSFEAKFNFRDLDRLRLRGNGWNSLNMGDFGNKWRDYYQFIREINEFLDRIDNSGAMQENPDKVNSLKAEMKFLRANIYSKLIALHGGVPLLDKALGLNDEFNIPRNTYEECVDFIVAELNEVATVLPATRDAAEFGRATALAALAVKSRTLLYAASKLHDPSTEPSGPMYDYTKATKWQDAANAAKEVIDMVGDRDLIAVNSAEDYRKLFLEANQDILFARPFGEFYDFGLDVNSLPNQTQAPSGYGGWALSSPTHNFALEFNMADGTTTNDATYDPANPNDNREMRYYANLNYQGAIFRGRAVDYALDVNEVNDGLDSPRGLGNVLHSSKTGYNIRKFQDESVGLTDLSPSRPYILYRLAEIYLNYAEANAELGNDAIARTYLNRVSTRALQPEITSSGDALKEAIKRERRIELCFERHNFFDERRWMNPGNLGFDIKGLKWTKDAGGNLVHEEYTVINRPWFNKHYYLPIPQLEIDKAPALIQNDGY